MIEVFWSSDPIRPGETAMFIGEGMAAVEAVELTSTRPPSRGTVTVTPIQVTERAVKAVIPQDWPLDVYACRLRARDAASETILLNAPELWWAQGDGGTFATPGGTLRLFGKNLALSDEARVLLTKERESNGRAVPIPVQSARLYAIEASVPDDLPEGRYEVRVQNGFGGESAASGAVTIEVRARIPWPETRFDVTAFGALGLDDADDTAAIQKALDAAGEAGGGIVTFPRGRYRLSDGLRIPRYVVLRGESRERVLLYWDDTDDPPEALLRGTNSFGIEDLTIGCANVVHVIAGDLGSEPDAGDVFLRRLRVRAFVYLHAKDPDTVDARFRAFLRYSSGGGDTVRLGGRNIEIVDCDFEGSGRSLFLSRVRGGYVARNTFSNGRWGWYCISGSDGLVFEKNRIVGGDLMSTGGGLNCLDGSSYSQNIYFAENELGRFFGWDREALTSDAGGGAYLGGVASSEGTTLTLAEEPNWGRRDWTGAAVFILGGRGAGQHRRITAFDGKRITLEAPWRVDPDESSEVSVTMLQRHYLIVGNRIEDATAAVQLYGVSIEHLIAENRAARAGGFHNLGLHYAGGFQPSWYVQFLDNAILEGNGLKGPLNEVPPKDSHISTFGMVAEGLRSPLTRGTVIRRNELLNNARIEVRGFCEDVLVEGNAVHEAEVGISVEPGSKGVLVRANRFENVAEPTVPEGLSE